MSPSQSQEGRRGEALRDSLEDQVEAPWYYKDTQLPVPRLLPKGGIEATSKRQAPPAAFFLSRM